MKAPRRERALRASAAFRARIAPLKGMARLLTTSLNKLMKGVPIGRGPFRWEWIEFQGSDYAVIFHRQRQRQRISLVDIYALPEEAQIFRRRIQRLEAEEKV